MQITPRGRETMRRTLWPLAALAVLAVIVAGCSSTSAGTGSSSGGLSTPNEIAPTDREEVRFEVSWSLSVAATVRPFRDDRLLTVSRFA
jgi:predicted small secreted protein